MNESEEITTNMVVLYAKCFLEIEIARLEKQLKRKDVDGIFRFNKKRILDFYKDDYKKIKKVGGRKNELR